MNTEINKLSFSDIFIYIIKKWIFFLLALIIGLIAGVLSNYLQKSKYRSKLTFSLSQGEDRIAGVLGLAAQYGFKVPPRDDIFNGDNIIELLKSRNIVEKVLLTSDTFNNKFSTLADYYQKIEKVKVDFTNTQFSNGESINHLTKNQRSNLYRLYTSINKNNLIVDRPDRRIGIYEVNLTTSDEKFSKIFTERLVAFSDSFYRDCCTRKARESLAAIYNRINNVKGSISQNIDRQAKIQDMNVNVAKAFALTSIKMKQSEYKALQAADEELIKNYEIANYDYLKQEPLMLIIDSCEYPLEKIRVSTFAIIFWCVYLSFLITFLGLLSIKIVSFTRGTT